MRLPRLRALTGSDTGRAAELGIAAMVSNVVALAFTLVFTRVLGQSGYGSLGALISTFLLLTVAGYALQTTVAREVSGALASGDPRPRRGGGRRAGARRPRRRPGREPVAPEARVPGRGRRGRRRVAAQAARDRDRSR